MNIRRRAADRLRFLMRRKTAAAPPPPAIPTYSEVAERDAVMRGWNNLAAGEICPGFPVGADDVVADIGCGHGEFSRLSAILGARVIMADINPEALAQARAALADLQPPAVFEAHLIDGIQLPIGDAIASRIICTEVIEHAADPISLMNEITRIGRPGALYLLACPDPFAEAIFKRIAHPSYFEPPNHIRIIGKDAFAEYVENAGLIIEHRLNRGFHSLLRWAFLWGCPPLGEDLQHPLLTRWDQTWSMLLEQENGRLVMNVLDDMLPKSQFIIARKP